MPAPAPFSQPLFPALYLYPLNESFVPKHIALLNNQHVKIGRQTNAKSTPGERNGFFDSKVLSRQHAEVWEDGGKIYIKDVKSSNGTFINGERLSPEGVDSEPFELKSDDIVEFGIDIVGDDNKSIIHHKVAARVLCVFSEQDVQVAARAEQHQQQHGQHYQPIASGSGQGGPSPVGQGPQFNFNPQQQQQHQQQQQQQRRTQIAQQGLDSIDARGGNMRPPGRSGLTFDHILSRLKGELQKSRETGAELHNLTGAMNEIQDTLGGSLPPNIPPYPHSLPSVRSSQPSSSQESGVASSSNSPPPPPAPPASAAIPASALSELQSRLLDTQTSLAAHVEKIRALEDALAEQRNIKLEVQALKDLVEVRQREMYEQQERQRSHSPPHDEPRGGFYPDEEDVRANSDEDDDDDARSVNTVTPHELERVEEEDEEQLAAAEAAESTSAREFSAAKETDEGEVEENEERRRRRDELGRPRTPEPTRLGMRDEDSFESRNRSSTLRAPGRGSAPSSLLKHVAISASNDDIFEQVVQLSIQVGTVVTLTNNLEVQHNAVQTTIQTLEGKVGELEVLVKATQEQQQLLQRSASPPPPPVVDEVAPSLNEERESLTQMLAVWKQSVEGQWSSVQEEWNQERERLAKAREEWETKVRLVDSGLERLASMQTVAAALQQQQQQQYQQQQQQFQAHQLLQQQHQQQFQQQLQQIGSGGDFLVAAMMKRTSGLVTPPSPRSLSADSNKPRSTGRRRKSASASASSGPTATTSTKRGRVTLVSRTSSKSRSRSRSRSRSGDEDVERVDTDTDATLASSSDYSDATKVSVETFGTGLDGNAEKARALATPDSLRMRSGHLSAVVALGEGLEASEADDGDDDGTTAVEGSVVDAEHKTRRLDLAASTVGEAVEDERSQIYPQMNVQTAVGVLVLSVAAAAVIWRVKPE